MKYKLAISTWRRKPMDSPPTPNKSERGKRKTRDTIKQILLLLIIQREGPIGRYRLKTLLEMADREGVVRAMLEEYQAANIITSSRQGAALTPQGHNYLQQLLRQYRILNIQQLTIPLMSTNPSTLGVHLQDCADQIGSAMDVRDIAIRGGAISATVVTYHDGGLTIPAVDPTFIINNPTFTEQLHTTFCLQPNDVVILISAESDWRGLEAGIHIATALAPEEIDSTS
jgi:predicted transcriptional regulator